MPRKFVFFLAALLTALPSGAMNSGTSPSRSVNLTIDNHFQKDAIERPARGEELIVAYYGHPNSRYMGIVGRYSLHELVEKVKATARLYQQLLPEHTIIPAIYLIYGTCQPQGRIGYLSDAIVNRYIDYAKDQNVKIILDHQIGSYSLKSAVDKLLPYLSFPHVHIAFDFEWRTSNPMKEIGFVMGEELNWMQKYVSDHLINNNIPGNKYIIFHQFTASMLREHHKASTGFPQVDLVHCTSGWGPPWQKKATHTFNATITQIPIKGFKLWYYYSDKPGIHYDSPLMVPQEVLALNPRPRIIIYQ
ncbi:MAG TPA: hypothetical protein DCG47_12750 [Spirochaetaceae bacterium]|nr:hypothetical protein [Spirochaetaceae bacterium]